MSTNDAISHGLANTPIRSASGRPNIGIAMPTTAYTRHTRCNVRRLPSSAPPSAAARRANAGNMLAATAIGPTARITARTWIESNSLVTRRR
ncbi:Uncharacterised protein [Mycobacteroides abscessus subsp. abscessus]|nr:Uncharacterised protein [Mycobacteroides abscessus subsp. abscessus]